MGDRFRRLITPGSIVRLIASIVLAFIVWGFVIWETNPERTREFTDVPIDVVGLAPNMDITNEIPTVDITLKGPEDTIRDITSTMVSAYVDLSDVTAPGVIEAQVQAAVPNGMRRVIVMPETVELDVQIIETRTFAIDVAEPGERPPNVSNVSLSQNLAQVIGSRANVEQVASVVVEVDFQGRSDSFEVEAPLIPVDEAGNRVPGVRVDPETITVQVDYAITEKALSVVVVCACVTDGNLEVRPFPEAVAIPSTITVTGPSPLLADLTEVRTQPIEIEGLDESGWILEVELDDSSLPPGVFLGEQSVDVWVPIEEERIRFDNVPIQVINISPEFRASLSADTVSFEVDGPRAALDAIRGTTPQAVVDGAGRGPGTYRVRVQVILPPELSYSELEPAEVELVVQRTQPQTSPPISLPPPDALGP